MKRYSLPALMILILLGQSLDGDTAEITVSGGLSTGVDLYDRQYKSSPEELEEEGVTVDDDEDDYQRVFIQPLLSIDRVDERSDLNFTYQPAFYYDFLNEEEDVNHQASLALRRQMTKDWELSLTDSFLQANNANRVETTDLAVAPSVLQETTSSGTGALGEDGQLSDDAGRRQYTTNSIRLLSEYGYRENSMFSLGYSFDILRNDVAVNENDYQDYDRHEASLSIDHQLTREWNASLAGRYIRGLFEDPDQDDSGTAANIDLVDLEPSDDLDEYHAEAGVEYEGIARHPLSLDYGLAVYDYDDEAQDDSEIHELTFGSRWLYSPHVTFNAGAGPSYATTDGQDDTWGYNVDIGADYTLERGRFGLSIEKGLERRNFTGEVEDNGLIDFWDSRADFSYRLLESTTVSLFAGYRYEDQDEVVLETGSLPPPTDAVQQIEDNLFETVTTQRFYTGCSLRYSFWQWYALDLSYRYADQISDTPEDEYDEHQVMLTLSFSTDFWRW